MLIDTAGKRIKVLRIIVGIDQTQLAERSGFAQGHISMLETGERNVTENVAHRLAPILNTNPSYLLLQTDDPNPEIGWSLVDPRPRPRKRAGYHEEDLSKLGLCDCGKPATWKSNVRIRNHIAVLLMCDECQREHDSASEPVYA